MNQLIQKGDLRRDEAEYYLAYTAILMDLASNYDWHSVLDFDYQHQEQQAAHDFPWGQINPAMELQVLVPRQRHTQRPREQHERRYQQTS